MCQLDTKRGAREVAGLATGMTVLEGTEQVVLLGRLLGVSTGALKSRIASSSVQITPSGAHHRLTQVERIPLDGLAGLLQPGLLLGIPLHIACLGLQLDGKQLFSVLRLG